MTGSISLFSILKQNKKLRTVNFDIILIQKTVWLKILRSIAAYTTNVYDSTVLN